MVTLITFEHAASRPDVREMTMEQAYKLAKNGGFYKAQIVDVNGIVAYEFKA